MSYLGEDVLSSEINVSEDVDVISTDSYDEKKILEVVKSKDINELFACALQFAIVGMGSKAYGEVKLYGKPLDCKALLIKHNVKINSKLNDKLEPDDLTVKRLARLFRYQISTFIRLTGRESFLYRKYSKSGSPDKIFPGSEYLVEMSDAKDLLDTYSELDKEVGTKFCSRVSAILKARKVI